MRRLHHYIRALFLFGFLLVPTGSVFADLASERQALEPRVEFSFRPGTERAIGVTEFWVPLAQDTYDGYVLYGDVRAMDDSQDNAEFNAGLGYRQMVDDGIWGAHLWYDRRLTSSGSKFNQVTLGGEWFSDDWDFKVNGYLPLNKDKTHERENPNGTAAQFSGNQILVNTNQSIVEEALVGLDLELGYRVPFMDAYTDSTRIYAAGFHFNGDKANNVTGWRTRVSSDITENIQLGARFQSDSVRGSQGFLEFTIRLPFGNKQSYKRQGLWARMDESPERDIDIVSNEEVIDAGNSVALVNTETNTVQNVIHVDNTAAGGGTGSNESRFNTLVAAEAAAGANDIIYVHSGDGTNTGMNAGIALNDSGQKLIGAGTNFTLSDFGLGTSSGIGTGSDILIGAGTAPVIGNAGGDGITITADDITVAGLTVNAAADDGIFADYTTGQDFSLVIRDMILSNSVGDGLDLRTSANSGITLDMRDSTFSSNGAFGAFLFLRGNGTGKATVVNNNFTLNTRDGYRSSGRDNFSFTSVLEGNTAHMNTEAGFNLRSEGAGQNFHTVRGNTASSNITFGVVSRQISGDLQLLFENNIVTSNATGVFIDDDSAGTNMVVDFGGGSLGSSGQNQISGSTGVDIRVDLDGDELKAENNWWGVNTGLAGGKLTLDAGSTIDTDPFLTEVP